jgi:ABC-2 type transport system ATP-binding protein
VIAIHTQDLVKVYAGKVRALDGVTFDVGEGEVFALLGPNGAGKTTTVRILTTLSQPTSGTARVAGFDVSREAGKVRRQIGVVAQKASLDPTSTGRENLILQGRFFGMGGRQLKQRVDELLTVVGLTDAADRLASTYSGGMARRLDIAIGLVHRPRVLFLDEPTTGLDPEVRAAMWDEIRRLAAQEGLTILLTTHYLEEADRLAGRLAIMDRGEIVTTGTPEALKAELRGDAIAVELANGAGESEVRSALAGVPGIGELQLDDHTVHLRVAAGATSLPGVLTALDANGVAVASATVSRPSLDDVYLRHTGRSFASAERTLQEATR